MTVVINILVAVYDRKGKSLLLAIYTNNSIFYTPTAVRMSPEDAEWIHCDCVPSALILPVHDVFLVSLELLLHMTFQY